MTISPVVMTITNEVQELRDLGPGESDFKGDFFSHDEYRVSPANHVSVKGSMLGRRTAWFSARLLILTSFQQSGNTPHGFRPTAGVTNGGRG